MPRVGPTLQHAQDKAVVEACAREAASDPACGTHFELHPQRHCRCVEAGTPGGCTAVRDQDAALYRFTERVTMSPAVGDALQGSEGSDGWECVPRVLAEGLGADELRGSQLLRAGLALFDTDPAAAMAVLKQAAALGSVPAQGKLARV